jgi:predicted Zn-dependent protease
MTTEAAADARSDYFDGTSSRKRRVELRFGEALGVVENGVVIATWPYESVRRADGPSRMLRLASNVATPLARLEIEDAATIAVITARCTTLDAGRGGSRQTRRVLLWSAAAAASLVGVIIYGVPLAAERLAPLVPESVERRIGEAVDTQVRAIFGSNLCTEPAGQAAFAAMVEKVRTAGGLQRPLNAHVLSAPIANAFALPGGKVYVTAGLLREARDADEVAGVLAHELGHVHHRHNMRTLIQTGGTSFLIGLLLGDVTGGAAIIFATQTMLNAAHSRGSEQQADTFAAAAMQRLGRSPLPMAELLFRITGEGKAESKALTIISSHPLTADRLEMMKKLQGPVNGPEILAAAEWKALKEICSKS